MKRRIFIAAFVLTFFLGNGYGNTSYLAEFKVENSKRAFPSSNTIKLNIEGLRSKKGKLIFAIFKDQESFKKRKPIKKIVLNKSEINKKEIDFQLGPGIYGISVLDDENKNDIMDYNFFGMPKEGFGFSDYYHTGLSKPVFDNFQFEVINGVVKKIEIRLRYM